MRNLAVREMGYAISFVVILAVLYAGAYYAMVERSPFGVGLNSDKGDPWLPWYPRFQSDSVYSFFSPIHELDLKIRREYWFGN